MKKTTSFRLKPYVKQQLKKMAAEHDMNIGDVIEALIKFQKSGQYVMDEEYQKRFNEFWKVSLYNSGGPDEEKPQ